MTTLQDYTAKRTPRIQSKSQADRREHRRHDLEMRQLLVESWDGRRRAGRPLGQIVDLSSGGVRIRTTGPIQVQADQQIRLRLELPTYAGICPFVDTGTDEPQPKNEWIGWLAVSRVKELGSSGAEVAGRLVDMDEMDRGMLGLYLSTQPLAA